MGMFSQGETNGWMIFFFTGTPTLITVLVQVVPPSVRRQQMDQNKKPELKWLEKPHSAPGGETTVAPPPSSCAHIKDILPAVKLFVRVGHAVLRRAANLPFISLRLTPAEHKEWKMSGARSLPFCRLGCQTTRCGVADSGGTLGVCGKMGG